jgi:23S rRNA (cytidine1920-2'-O)/16S rRNA (cytidine1409-2'-O)-methyltransferase
MPRKRRLDLLLVERGLAPSRQKAQASIMAGDVLVNGERTVRQAASVAEDAEIEVVPRSRYVGRGGEKLEHALRVLHVDPSGLTCVDAGASTGGFTDCLLQRGAKRVYAIDAGYGQLAHELRHDGRVVVLERTNVRNLPSLPDDTLCDMATIDVSFIGLEKVVPAVRSLLRPRGRIIALVKPQFQAARAEVGKGGVVREAGTHSRVLGRVLAWAAGEGLRFGGLTTSPLHGPAGNKEFFVLWRTGQTLT